MGKSEGNAELRKVKLEKRAQNTTDDDEADKPSGGPDHDTDNYSDVESDVTEPDFDQEETYDVGEWAVVWAIARTGWGGCLMGQMPSSTPSTRTLRSLAKMDSLAG